MVTGRSVASRHTCQKQENQVPIQTMPKHRPSPVLPMSCLRTRTTGSVVEVPRHAWLDSAPRPAPVKATVPAGVAVMDGLRAIGRTEVRAREASKRNNCRTNGGSRAWQAEFAPYLTRRG